MNIDADRVSYYARALFSLIDWDLKIWASWVGLGKEVDGPDPVLAESPIGGSSCNTAQTTTALDCDPILPIKSPVTSTAIRR